MIKIEITSKPISIPIFYQPIHKLIMLLAVLKYGVKSPHKAPFVTLHLYLWALRQENNFESLLDVAKNRRTSIPPWSFEPGLEKTITITLVNKYCKKSIVSGNLEITLTDTGKETLSRIEQYGIFQEDIQKIKTIGIIAKSTINKVARNWSTS